MTQHFKISRTTNIPRPNAYIDALLGEYAAWAFTEDAAPGRKGKWRSDVFKVDDNHPLDLEIGTGNGTHFAHHCLKFPNRSLIGLELKYKPLIQSIRRAVKSGAVNGRMARYHGHIIDSLFSPDEINNVYIHFPDPWTKKKKHKNRLIQKEFLEMLHKLMKADGKIEFKTDSREYFDWALPLFEQSPFSVDLVSEDLHNSSHKEKNYITQFESIFIRQGLPIHYVALSKT